MAIYLPRGPLLEKRADDASNIRILKAELPHPVVQINYRYSSTTQYPTPIHDVAAGYDWIVSNLLPKRAISRAGRSERVGRIAVCGELVGGSLATAFALTECRLGEPGIIAAAVNNPIADWVDLEGDAATPVKNKRKTRTSLEGAGLSSRDFLARRKMLFRKPEHYHDPFASPALFFRTAGMEVPSSIEDLPLDELDELALLEREQHLREQGEVVRDDSSVPSAPGRTRKTSRRYPSKALSLRLPTFHITTGLESPIAGQAVELAHLLRQSFERQGKSASTCRDEDSDVRPTSKTVLQYEAQPGLGLWDDTKAGRARMLGVAKWLRQALDGSSG